jgi:transcriptional regulator with GAF, ATPase, and Fis domain
MNAMLSMAPGGLGISECDPLALFARRTAVESGPFPVDTSAELLRTLAEVLDVRAVFPRVSEIVKHVLPHDALELVFHDRSGHSTLEARSTDDLAGLGCTRTADEDFYVVSDLRTRSGLSGCAPESVEPLLDAGYRSVLNVRGAARNQVMHLGFFSKHPDAYGPNDVSTARRIADYVAVAVAHEQLAAVERDRAEARGRAERVDARVRALAEQSQPLSAQGKMIGRSDAWRRVLGKALRVASTETTVFLQGESGTGKEVVARFIHQASPRKSGPFIAINCAALPEQLLESELFGYERGAFTGANLAKAGQIELAAKGVLFLDEVSEMSLTAQAKFLRFLQEREFQRLGGTRIQKANVRVIAASNRDLRQAVERGTFREDLFYRLEVFDIQLPPLRDRISDVPLFADEFLEEFGRSMGRPPTRLGDDAREALMSHSWPGNVRELRNVLERAAILSDGAIERRHLSLHSRSVTAASPHDLGGIERQMIEDALRQTDGNKSKTARRLGLTRTQLYVRLRRYGLEHVDTSIALEPAYADGGGGAH